MKTTSERRSCGTRFGRSNNLPEHAPQSTARSLLAVDFKTDSCKKRVRSLRARQDPETCLQSPCILRVNVRRDGLPARVILRFDGNAIFDCR